MALETYKFIRYPMPISRVNSQEFLFYSQEKGSWVLYRKQKNKKAEDQDVRDFLYQNNKISDYEIEFTINKINQELDENQQKLIKMSFFEQKSHKKIAEELEIPLGTVKSRIRSTLNKMQKFLKWTRLHKKMN